MNKREIPILTISGSPSSMGEQHGLAMKKQIKELVEIRTNLLLQESGAKISHLKSIAEQAWSIVCTAVPYIAEEVAATAFTSHVSEWELMISGAYSDIADVLHAELECSSECTIGIIPIKSRIYGTWDSHFDAVDRALILKRVSNDGVTTIALTTAGWPIQFGVNSNGLAFGITNLTPQTATARGIPYIAVISQIGFMKNVDEAKHWLYLQKFMSGHSYILVDQKNALVIETTSETTASHKLSESFVQANHYASNIDDNSKYKFLKRSIIRKLELQEAIDSITDTDVFLHWLNAHPNVLRIPNSGSNIASCAIYSIDAKEKCIWVASSFDYQGNMQKISL